MQSFVVDNMAQFEIADDVERQELAVRAGVEVIWLARGGRPAGTTSLLLDALRAVEPGFWEAAPYVWGGYEHGAARAVREHLKRELRFSKGRSMVAAYWMRGQAGDFEE